MAFGGQAVHKQFRAVEGRRDTASTPEMWAKTFAASKVITDARMRRMQRRIEWKLIRKYLPHGTRVLDAGCGLGEWVRVMAARGYRATGVDYSPALIARLRAAYPDGSWIEGDLREIPVCAESFDGVISWGVIEHDEAGPAAALKEFHRILVPGGTTIVSVPVDSAAQRRATRFLFPDHSTMAFFQYAMTPDELGEALRSAGFQVLAQGSIPGAAFALMAPSLCVWSRGKGLPGRLLERVGTAFAGQLPSFHLMIYAVGRKPRETA